MLDDFLVRAALAGLGLALAAAPLGCFVAWRRMAYFGDATAHAAILGVALSLWLADQRIAFASGTAFLAAQLLDVAVFNRLRDGLWWKAPLVSSVIAGIFDSILFWTLAFYASDFAGWWNYGIVDWAAKLTVTLAMLVPFRMAISGLRTGRNHKSLMR